MVEFRQNIIYPFLYYTLYIILNALYIILNGFQYINVYPLGNRGTEPIEKFTKE